MCRWRLYIYYFVIRTKTISCVVVYRYRYIWSQGNSHKLSSVLDKPLPTHVFAIFYTNPERSTYGAAQELRRMILRNEHKILRSVVESECNVVATLNRVRNNNREVHIKIFWNCGVGVQGVQLASRGVRSARCVTRPALCNVWSVVKMPAAARNALPWTQRRRDKGHFTALHYTTC